MNNNPGYPVYTSISRDLVLNLAFEEYLLSTLGSGQTVLFLYENDPAVVVGRFQNPWKECRTGLARRNGIPIRRRISGGGTVIHGPGNLNYSIISGRKTPEKELNQRRVIKALSSIGVRIQQNDRYDLLIRKPDSPDSGLFKISGSAFRQTTGVSMHHATLLVNADLDSLRGLLHNPPRKLKVRGVASNPSPVANLTDLYPELTVQDLILLLSREWGAVRGPETIDPADYSDKQIFKDAAGRLVSESWVWGKTPQFTETFSDLPGMDGIDMLVSVREGRIGGIDLQGAESKVFADIADKLIGCRYHGTDIVETAGARRNDYATSMAAIVDGDGSEGIFLP